MKKLFILSLAALSLVCCSKDDGGDSSLVVTPDTIALYVDGTKQITTSAGDATFKVADEFYASVSEDGIVTANKVGSTEVIVSSKSGTATVPVHVLNQYSLYPDLDGLIGKTYSDVIKVMGSNYTESTASSGNITYSYTAPTSYTVGIVFQFAPSTGLCETVGVVVSTAYTSMLSKYLIERYTVAGMQNDYYFFLNHDEDVLIGLNVYNSSSLIVLYVKRDSSKASSGLDAAAFCPGFME